MAAGLDNGRNKEKGETLQKYSLKTMESNKKKMKKMKVNIWNGGMKKPFSFTIFPLLFHSSRLFNY